MTVALADRYTAEETIRRWLDLTASVPVMDLGPADTPQMGWIRHARCGQWQPDAPDPDLFHPTEADLDETYVARDYCLECPVRQYCDAAGTANRYPGVWAGIFRDSRGMPAPLCVNAPRCMRYRKEGRTECSQCIQAAGRKAAKQARHNQRRIRERAEARTAREAAATTPAGDRPKEVVAA